jgi:8-amino-7-oxononanoate synthase
MPALDPLSDLAADLDGLSARGRRRMLVPGAGLDFTSNDYLGFAASAELKSAAAAALSRGIPVGSGGSRLLRGNHPEHERLEDAACRYFGSRSALFFATGYAANQTFFATVPQRGDLVVYDELLHASVLDGLRCTRAATVRTRHNELESVEEEIRGWRVRGGTGRAWIAVESLYSMDGNGPDLAALDVLAQRYDAMLVVDEAHATGVLGPNGRGRAAFLEGQPHVVTIHTCGKALGTAGALVCGPPTIKDFLVNRGRAFIFSTAPSPLMAAITTAALDLCRRSDDRRDRLQRLVDCAARAFDRHCGLTASGTHILPVRVGDDGAAVDLAARLRRRGYDVRAIRPPTVPHGTARLRIALTLNVDETAVEQLALALAEER